MSEVDKLNWSVDLRRISWWLQTGEVKLAGQFIERGKKLYSGGPKVGNRDWKWWMEAVQQEDRMKAAEVALTWSALLK